MKIDKIFAKKINKRKRIMTCILAAIITITAMGNLFFVNMNAEANKVTILSQERVDIYYQNTAASRNRASMYVLADEAGNQFRAFCADGFKENPPDNTVLSVEESTDKRLLKVLYYGFNGPSQWEGFNDVPGGAITSYGSTREALVEAYARVATTMCATGVRNNKAPENIIALKYWNYLFGDNPAPEVCDVNLTFSNSNPSVNICREEDKYLQKTDIIEAYGDERYYTYIQIPEGITIHIKGANEADYASYTAPGININGGSSFYFTADIRYTGSIELDSGLINEQQYYVITAAPEDERYQVLAALKTKNKYTNSLYVPFNAPKGRLMVSKHSSNEAATTNNPSYSLEGAAFGIYGSLTEAENDTNRLDTIYTDINGNAYKEELLFGSYYVKELESPRGYKLDNKIYEVNIDSEIGYYNIDIAETPLIYQTDLLVKKVDEDGMGIKDVEFLVKYYKLLPDAAIEDLDRSSPERSYVMHTDEEGLCRLSAEYRISGDEFYYTEDGKMGFPKGIITIEEISAPDEYLIDNELRVIPIGNEQKVGAYVYKAPVVENIEKRCVIRLHKTGETDSKELADAAETKNLENIKFSLYAKEDIKSKTGKIKYKKGELVDTFVTDEDGCANSNKLYIGSYILVEEASDENEGYVIMDNMDIDLSKLQKEASDFGYYYSLSICNSLKPKTPPEEKEEFPKEHEDNTTEASTQEASTQEVPTLVLSEKYVKTGDTAAVNAAFVVCSISAFLMLCIFIFRKRLGK